MARSLQASNAVAQEGYRRYPFPPVDEADQDPELVSFRAQLLKAVGARDVKATSQLLGQNPPPRMAAAIAIGPEAEDWSRLQQALNRGGTLTTTRGAVNGRREFCAPYVYSAYPRLDALHLTSHELEPWVIVSRDAALRDEPREDARVLMSLFHELIQPTGDARPGGDPNWYRVIAFDGREGWVRSSEIRDSQDFHACFAKIDGRWTMTAFDQAFPK